MDVSGEIKVTESIRRAKQDHAIQLKFGKYQGPDALMS